MRRGEVEVMVADLGAGGGCLPFWWMLMMAAATREVLMSLWLRCCELAGLEGSGWTGRLRELPRAVAAAVAGSLENCS